ncbi:MAG: methyltransferase domain-containing protein [Limnothrix sp.]
MTEQSLHSASFWESKYQTGQSRWDLGQPAPPLVSFFESAIAPQAGNVVVLGCGQGHDAVFLAQQGLAVTAVDFAPSAIAATKELAQQKNCSVDLLEQDIFTLAASHPRQFQFLFEHTCFCAIAPEQRQKYVELAASILQPQGQLFGIFFTHDRAGGPPFGSTPAEIRALFSTYFDVLTLTPISNSVPSRQEDEHWAIFQKKVLS